jgi:type I restriction enzyme R subunit
MALIVSPGQNEIAQMKALGLDIEPHRKRMCDSQPPLDERFKDTEDKLRLAFVCAMWLTGFDAPSCSTIYLDKPMRNHTLMQTIARANRIFPGKHSGMIVDYANVFASLEKALAIYGMGQGGDLPVKDKQKLVAALHEAADAAATFCGSHQVSLAEIENLPIGGMQRLTMVADAVDALISPDPRRQEFLGHERLVSTLYGAVKPDPAALVFSGRAACLGAIADAIRAKTNPGPVDISEVMREIKEVLDGSIVGIDMPVKPGPRLDLSKIDFEALAKRFKKSQHKNTELEILKAVIRAKLDQMIRLNRTRANFRDKFEELIEAYNNGSRNIDDLFDELRKLGRSFTEEEHRHVRENLTEEELVILDILTRPAPELTTAERTEIKKVAKDLIGKIRRLLAENLNWRQTSKARAQIRLAIADSLDGLPEAYSKDLYEKKCAAVFEHVYESYADARDNVYTTAG